MKKLILLLFVLSIFSPADAIVFQQAQPVTYTCIMHPEIHARKPGNCPKCGMTVVKEKSKTSKKKTTPKQYKTEIRAHSYSKCSIKAASSAMVSRPRSC